MTPMKSGGSKPAEPEPARMKKQRITFQLPVDLIEKARDVVYFSPGLTLSTLLQEALLAQVKKLEKTHGKPFPSRAGAAIKTGRPVKPA
jgi:hypothetical protein